MNTINKKTLEYLAELARLDLKSGEEEKLLKDLQAILDYFKEIQKLDTTNIEPMTGGTHLENIFREDVGGETEDTGKGPEAFPDKQGRYLKVPPVF